MNFFKISYIVHIDYHQVLRVIYREARPLSDDFSSLNMCFSDRESEQARDNLYQIESITITKKETGLDIYVEN